MIIKQRREKEKKSSNFKSKDQIWPKLLQKSLSLIFINKSLLFGTVELNMIHIEIERLFS